MGYMGIDDNYTNCIYSCRAAIYCSFWSRTFECVRKQMHNYLLFFPELVFGFADLLSEMKDALEDTYEPYMWDDIDFTAAYMKVTILLLMSPICSVIHVVSSFANNSIV